MQSGSRLAASVAVVGRPSWGRDCGSSQRWAALGERRGVGQFRPLPPVAAATTLSANSRGDLHSPLVPLDAVRVRAASHGRRRGVGPALLLLIAVALLNAAVGASHGERQVTANAGPACRD